MISVIVPIFNADKFLCRCIDSILAQSYTDFELLLINDGSKDTSGAICDAYAAKDSRVRVFHKENGGVSSARNLGLDNAQGEYITFCDADDFVDTDWLFEYSNFIVNNVDIAIQGYCTIVNSIVLEKTLQAKSGNSIEAKRQLITTLMSQGDYGYLWVKLFRRDLIESYRIRFDVNSAFREDEQFVSRYLEYANRFECINCAHYQYFFPPDDRAYYTSHNIGYTSCQTLLSLNRIFDNNIPIWIFEKEYVYIKDYMAEIISNLNVLEQQEIDMYKLMVTSLNYTKKYSHKIINFLIINSQRFPNISIVGIKIIRIIGNVRLNFFDKNSI